jgi:hypothetical protein
MKLSSLGTADTVWPIVLAPDDRWLWSSRWNENWQGKPKYSEKTFPSATLSTTNPTWPDLGSNRGSRGGKPVTNRLSCGTWCTTTKQCFVYYLKTLLVANLYSGEWYDSLMNWKEAVTNRDSMQTLAWRGCGNPWETSAKITSVPEEIRMENFLNASVDSYTWANPLGDNQTMQYPHVTEQTELQIRTLTRQFVRSSRERSSASCRMIPGSNPDRGLVLRFILCFPETE